MKIFLTSGLCLVSIVFVGCMHTVVGGFDVSPDKKYKLAIEVHGASGKAYTAQSKKRIHLWLKPNIPIYPEPPIEISKSALLVKKYVFQAADLAWRANWLGSEEVTVEFFERKMPSNHIASVTFYRDLEKNEFVEK